VTDRQILRIIGQNVKRARLRANLTQECLAELIGAHWQTINYFENGRYPCSITKFARISQALDVSPNRLLEGLPAPDRVQMERIKRVLARKRRPVGG
jgi:DNA-binding XRE family transcriptional regulator